MTDYQKMYSALFNAMTNAIKILQQAQRDAEETYMSAEEEELLLLVPDEKNGEHTANG